MAERKSTTPKEPAKEVASEGAESAQEPAAASEPAESTQPSDGAAVKPDKVANKDGLIPGQEVDFATMKRIARRHPAPKARPRQRDARRRPGAIVPPES